MRFHGYAGKYAPPSHGWRFLLFVNLKKANKYNTFVRKHTQKKSCRPAHPAGLNLPANQSSNFVDFDLPAGYLAERIFAPPLQSPQHVAVSPSGAIVVTGGDADRVIQVHEDGTLTTYADPSSYPYSGIAFDAAGNLYVGDWAGVLWKVTPAGTATQLASGIPYNYSLDVAPSGDVFAVGNSTVVLRITPAGQVSVYASGLSKANDVAVSPITGQVYVMDWDAGAIFRANPNGTVTLLTSGLSNDSTYIAFAPDGLHVI